jgi:hypothetical protein
MQVELAGRKREGFISKGRTMSREGCFLSGGLSQNLVHI